MSTHIDKDQFEYYLSSLDELGEILIEADQIESVSSGILRLTLGTIMASKGAIFVFDRANSSLSELTSISIKEKFSDCTLSEKFIENIQIIEKNKDNIYNLNFSDFFKEYSSKNMAFVIIEINKNKAKIFLNTKIEGKKIKKTLLINQENLNQIEFQNKIISEIKNTIKDLIKLQNLIDVRTPSFLNVEIKLDSSGNLVEFHNRIKNIDLIDDYYVQRLNKDFALVKIKFLGKIDKIINKLKDKNIDLKMYDGQWQLNIT